jgi:hypothetical protein
MNPMGRESVRGRCSADAKYRGRLRTPGSLPGSGGRGSTGGCVVFACGAESAAAPGSDGGGATGKGGRIDSKLLTIGVGGTTGVVRAECSRGSRGSALLTIGVEGTTVVVRAECITPETGAVRAGTFGSHDGRPHVIARPVYGGQYAVDASADAWERDRALLQTCRQI